MRNRVYICLSLAITSLFASSNLLAAELCKGYGPQTPRDISSKIGTNKQNFSLVKSIDNMNLCNIHLHTNAEHKGPGFSVSAGSGKHGGFKCNASSELTKAELVDPVSKIAKHTKSSDHKQHDDIKEKRICHGVKPGDTIEVHWVYTSCAVKPGVGLGACLSKKCANPQLRVESKAFLVVNDKSALDFNKFTYQGNVVNGFHQAKSLPIDKGAPVLFQGSTTGPDYSKAKCSAMQVTWNVRPNCAKVDISSLHKWCESNVFKEDHAHGVRQLVTSPELLSEIK